MDGWMNGWINRWMDGQIDGWMDERMDGYMNLMNKDINESEEILGVNILLVIVDI